MKLQKCLTEASRESGCRLGYTSFGTCKLCREARKEVILRLLGSKNRNRRKNAESVCRKEDYVLCVGRRGNGANNIFDVVNRVRNAGVLGNALVVEVYLAVFIKSNVFKKRVALYSVINIRL